MGNKTEHGAPHTWASTIGSAILWLFGGLVAFYGVAMWIADLQYTARVRAPWPTANATCLVAGQKPLTDAELMRRAVAQHARAGETVVATDILWYTPEIVRKDRYAENLPSWQESEERTMRLGLKRWAYVHMIYGADSEIYSVTYDACGNEIVRTSA